MNVNLGFIWIGMIYFPVGRSLSNARRVLPYNNSGNELSTGQRQSRKIGEMEPFALTYPLAFREFCHAARINFGRDQIRTDSRRNPRLSREARVSGIGSRAPNKNGICFRLCYTTRDLISSSRGIACPSRSIHRHYTLLASVLFRFLFSIISLSLRSQMKNYNHARYNPV